MNARISAPFRPFGQLYLFQAMCKTPAELQHWLKPETWSQTRKIASITTVSYRKHANHIELVFLTIAPFDCWQFFIVCIIDEGYVKFYSPTKCERPVITKLYSRYIISNELDKFNHWNHRLKPESFSEDCVRFSTVFLQLKRTNASLLVWRNTSRIACIDTLTRSQSIRQRERRRHFTRLQKLCTSRNRRRRGQKLNDEWT